jgi:hypothetical protein
MVAQKTYRDKKVRGARLVSYPSSWMLKRPDLQLSDYHVAIRRLLLQMTTAKAFRTEAEKLTAEYSAEVRSKSRHPC